MGKSVPYISHLSETTRDGLNKSFIPRFLWKPPFGYPRFTDLPYIRWLAKTSYVEMCISTILDELSSIPWDVIPNPVLPETEFKDDNGDLKDEAKAEMSHIKSFFMNPNTNKESFEDVFIRAPVRDILEINTGVLNKVFNLKGEMVEVVARDGTTFTKNPDVHGMMTHREDILFPKIIVDKNSLRENSKVHLSNSIDAAHEFDPLTHITTTHAREKAAYFQFGWIAGPKPTPYGKREIVWLQKNQTTYDIYGFSPAQVLAKSLQTLIWQIDSDLEYYNNNNVPKGMIGLEGSDADEIRSFKEQWKDQQHELDEFGNKRKIYNSVPILNFKPQFTKIEFSASELQIIEKQQWYTKMVWASYGVTATALGYTEDAQGQSNQIVQSKTFRKKAINPMLRLLENRYNGDIVSEFEYNMNLNVSKGKKIEVPKYTFVFKMFDTDEERQKYELYKLQTSDSGLMTINEVRNLEGKDPLDWGDDDPRIKPQAANTFNFPGGTPDNDLKDPDEDAKKNDLNGRTPNNNQPDQNAKKTEKQNNNQDGKSGIKKKAKISDNPLILKPGEKISDYKKFGSAIKFVLKQNENKLKELLEKEFSNRIIDNIKSNSARVEVKSVPDIIKRLAAILSFEGIKNLTMEVIKNNFFTGFEDVEEQLDKNFVPDANAISFLGNHTFNNIKGMTDDIENKLRSELERGVINGEGIDKLKDRVSNVFKVSEGRAESIARTETARAENQGKLNAMKQSGTKAKKYILITLDNRTSEVSKAMDRKYGSPEEAIGLNEEFSVIVNGKEFSGQAPPFMPNDRDVVQFTIPDEEE